MCRLQEMIAGAEARGESLAAGTVIVAESLRHSSGRFGRKWYAPEGGAWLAVAWPDILLPEFTRLLPFAVGLACCRAIRGFQLEAQLKWVNDVLLAGKKVAGILCETVLSGKGERYHLLGVGVNVNNAEFPEELIDVSTSLCTELGKEIDLAEFIYCFLAELTIALGILHHDEALAMQELQNANSMKTGTLLHLWQSLSDSRGRRVLFGHDVQQKPLYQALVTGFDRAGAVKLQLTDGTHVTECSGEIRYL
jgi:BirA family biotin operon repressor/biotin-[acetyl-CoA-carboxylase] ligase